MIRAFVEELPVELSAFGPVRRRAAVAGLFGLATLLFCSCSDNNSGLGRVFPVSGSVTEAGKALTKGNVTFHPVDKAGYLPAGTIDEQGKYTLTTRGAVGAPAGKYKVVVSVQVPSNPKDPYSVPKSLIHAKYGKPETTDLVVEVKDNPTSGDYDLNLKK
jgi:hypothetical protein